MGRDLEALPLFPLNAVVFPYADIRLHIYEDRYKRLVRHCLENDSPFGIVLIRSGKESDLDPEPYLVGTAVQIISVNPLEDGRMDILLRGQRRFRIRRLDESSSYQVGYVEPIIELEVEDTPRKDALALKIQEYVQGYFENLISPYEMKVSRINLPNDPTELSFVVANLLQIDNLEKQKLLETTDTLERMADMIGLLERQIVEADGPTYYKLSAEHFRDTISPN